MQADDFSELQKSLNLSDRKMAEALGVTRQTWRNWRTGRPIPVFVQNAMRWMIAVRTLDPSNDNLPDKLKSQ